MGVWSALSEKRSLHQNPVAAVQSPYSHSDKRLQERGRECMPRVPCPLGFHLSSALIEKIWKGDYIDLVTVLPLARDFSQRYGKQEDKLDEEKCKPVLK